MGTSMPAQLHFSFKASKQDYMAINFNFNKINLIFSSKTVNQFILINNEILIRYDTSSMDSSRVLSTNIVIRIGRLWVLKHNLSLNIKEYRYLQPDKHLDIDARHLFSHGHFLVADFYFHIL